jgi:hypothetical protein
MTTPSEDKLEEMQQKMDITSSTTTSSDKVRDRIAAKTKIEHNRERKLAYQKSYARQVGN